MIEQLSTYDVERKYLCYTGNSNDKQFPDEISKYVNGNDTDELHTLAEQIEQDKDTTLISEVSFVGQLQGAKSIYLKILAQQNYGYNIHYINIVKQFIRAGRTGNRQNYSHIPFLICQICKALLATNR